jgi:YggT family protein
MLAWSIVALVLWLCYWVVWARILIEITRIFARRWRPAGLAALGLEVVYASTDVALRPIRRLCPPVRIGTVRLDLSVLILLLVILALRYVALRLA